MTCKWVALGTLIKHRRPALLRVRMQVGPFFDSTEQFLSAVEGSMSRQHWDVVRVLLEEAPTAMFEHLVVATVIGRDTILAYRLPTALADSGIPAPEDGMRALRAFVSRVPCVWRRREGIPRSMWRSSIHPWHIVRNMAMTRDRADLLEALHGVEFREFQDTHLVTTCWDGGTATTLLLEACCREAVQVATAITARYPGTLYEVDGDTMCTCCLLSRDVWHHRVGLRWFYDRAQQLGVPSYERWPAHKLRQWAGALARWQVKRLTRALGRHGAVGVGHHMLNQYLKTHSASRWLEELQRWSVARKTWVGAVVAKPGSVNAAAALTAGSPPWSWPVVQEVLALVANRPVDDEVLWTVLFMLGDKARGAPRRGQFSPSLRALVGNRPDDQLHPGILTLASKYLLPAADDVE